MHYVLEGHKPLIEAKSALAKAEQSHDDLAYASALAAYTEINEGAVVARAKEILHGLGFKDTKTPKERYQSSQAVGETDFLWPVLCLHRPS